MNQMSEEGLQQLEAANRKLNILMENMPGGVIVYEADSGRIREVSRSLLDMFGCSEEKFRDHYCNSFYLLIYKTDRARVRDMMEQQMNFLPNVEISFRTRDLLGECKYLDYRGRVVTEPDGGRVVYAVLNDASERVLVQQELQRMNEMLYVEMQRLKLLQEAVDDIPFDYNILRDEMEITLKRTKNNHVVIDGFRAEREYTSLISADTLEQAVSVFEAITTEPKKGTLECRIHLTEDQPYVWYRIYFVSFRDNDGRMSRVVGCANDISDEKKNEESLVNRLKIDPMTGILNKTSMQNVISEYLTLSKPTDLHALFMIDTDNFKAVNDNLGHMMGDEVIQIVAKTVKETFRDSDYVGRVGGDEFMAFMKNTTPEATLNRASALNASMRRTFEKDGISVSVSCSIGIAFYAKDGDDFETLYRNADARLYLAKRNGKDRFEYQ